MCRKKEKWETGTEEEKEAGWGREKGRKEEKRKENVSIYTYI